MVQNLRSRLSQAAAYPGRGVYTRINSSFRGLRKPRPELAAAHFLSYKRPYCYIMGDFNLDALHYDQHAPTQEFMDGLFSHMLFPIVTRPTRITAPSATLERFSIECRK